MKKLIIFLISAMFCFNINAYSSSICIYDGNEPYTSFTRADSEDFKRTAERYDYAISVNNVSDAYYKLLLLKYKNVVINKLYILDHGNSGIQTLGERGINPKSLGWKDLAKTVEIDGSITLLGCHVAKGSRGKQYLQTLANTGQRKIIGYTGIGFCRFIYVNLGRKIICLPIKDK